MELLGYPLGIPPGVRFRDFLGRACSQTCFHHSQVSLSSTCSPGRAAPTPAGPSSAPPTELTRCPDIRERCLGRAGPTRRHSQGPHAERPGGAVSFLLRPGAWQAVQPTSCPPGRCPRSRERGGRSGNQSDFLGTCWPGLCIPLDLQVHRELSFPEVHT